MPVQKLPKERYQLLPSDEDVRQERVAHVGSPIRRLEDRSNGEYHDVIGANLDSLGVDSLWKVSTI